MAWKPPIDYQNKKHLLDWDRFFKEISSQCPYVDEEHAKVFWLYMLGHIRTELLRSGVVRLPELGDMALVQQKARPGWAGRHQVMLPEMKVLKFYPRERLRRAFAKWRYK